jgi:hypothetical protein
MEKVVYLLGAGFSAPAGLPLMNNFLMKAKDQYFADEKYSYFKEVFAEIEELSKIKLYYNSDLFNIEEIISLFEMKAYLSSNRLRKIFNKFIIDVIEYYTLDKDHIEFSMPGNWYDFIFGGERIHRLYGYFVASLLGLNFGLGSDPRRVLANSSNRPPYRYSLISLNYDMLLENIVDYIYQHMEVKNDIHFQKENITESWTQIPYLKLHGSCDLKKIIPPTWSKGIRNNLISKTWKNAFDVLSQANHIRVIGYSLPETDSYIKYLLKTAVIKNEHLKSIDIICLDNDETIKTKYYDFVDFKYMRFRNTNTENYLQTLFDATQNKKFSRTTSINMINLESVHDSFMHISGK